jgi:hypothetical protein
MIQAKKKSIRFLGFLCQLLLSTIDDVLLRQDLLRLHLNYRCH